MTNLIAYFSLLILGVFSAIKKYWLIILLFILLPFYAFLITYAAKIFHISFSVLELVRLFKEIILIGVFTGLLWDWFRNKIQTSKAVGTPATKEKEKTIGSKVSFFISDFFILLYLIVLLGSALVFHSTLREVLFGVRYDFFFLLYYFIFRLFLTFYNQKKETIIKIIFWTALPVFVFAILQFFALPKDFLVRFGYVKEAVSTFDPVNAIPAFQLLGNSSWLRVQSFFSGPNQLAAYCLVIIFLALGKILLYKKNILAYFVAILGIATLILTFSRSAWVGFLVGLIVLAIINIKRKPIFAGLVLGLTLAIGLLAGFLFKNQLYEVLVRPSSTLWHITYFRDAYAVFLEHPFGIGLSKIGPASQWLGHPLVSESFYLQIALETGFFGAILFIAIMILLIWEIAQTKKQINFSVISIIISLLVASLFLHTMADGVLAVYVGFVLALAQVENKELSDKSELAPQKIMVSHE
jgi:O-antigen ligase